MATIPLLWNGEADCNIPMLEYAQQVVKKELHSLIALHHEGSLEVEDFTTLESLSSFIEPGDWESMELYQFEMLTLWAAVQHLRAVAKPEGRWSYWESLGAVILWLTHLVKYKVCKEFIIKLLYK